MNAALAAQRGGAVASGESTPAVEPAALPVSMIGEAERLAALYRYGILDSGLDPDFDLLAAASAEICRAPYAYVSFVDADRVWIKAAFGSPAIDERRCDSYCALAIRSGGVFEIPDLANDARTMYMRHTTGGLWFRMYAGAVLRSAHGHHLGTLCVLDTAPRELTDHQRSLLAGLGRQVMQLVESGLQQRKLTAALAELERLATTDPLTGLANRRAMMSRLKEEDARRERYGQGYCIVMLDLDHFKKVNDTFGHAAGDLVLTNVAAQLKAHLRAGDLVARFGGEEFCVLLTNTREHGGLAWAEQFGRHLSDFKHLIGDATLNVTCSMGVAEAVANDRRGAARVLAGADKALYKAKAEGRNRVCEATSVDVK